VVQHVEGGSSGTDLTRGVKRAQAVNQTTFVHRWRMALVRQPVRPSSFDRGALVALSVCDTRPRVLVSAPVMPEFDREGGSRRVFHLIEFLQDAGWAVTFAPCAAGDGGRYARILRQRGVAVYTHHDDDDSDGREDEHFADVVGPGRFDLAVLAFWNAAERVIRAIRAYSPATRVIVDSIDLHFLRHARQTLRPGPNGRAGQLDEAYGDAMRREMNAYAAADAVLAVSDTEARYINQLTGDRGLATTVPLAEDLDRSPVEYADRRGVLFIGNFRHAPNLEGLAFLCREVLPLVDPGVRAAHPFVVVGNGVDDRVRAVVEGVSDVRLVGWVPSLIPYLHFARVAVAPLLHGAGTKTKLIQALMTGTPSVSSTIGIEGLDLEHGRHVLVADTAPAFASAIERLAVDAALWERLRADGRTHVERAHGRPAVRARFQAVVNRVVGMKIER
jgi:glycosyltransferase involved in cell wall biosynthesis